LTTAVTRFGIGTPAQGGAGGWNGDIAEVIYYSAALSNADRARVEAYLAAKWGVSGVHSPISLETSAVASPLELSGCVGWWDSSDLSAMRQNSDGTGVVAAGDPVGYWADKSSTGSHVTGSGSARPTLSATGFNSRQALVFNGSSTNLSRDNYTATNSLSGMTRIAVCANTVNALAALSRVNGGGSDMFMFMNGSVRAYVSGTPNFLSVPLSTGNSIVPAGLYGEVFSNSAISFYSSGVGLAGTVSGTIPATTGGGTPTLHIGSNSGVNYFWNGPIAEYIIFNRDLTRVELARVEKYLAAKWGISGVPDPTPPVGYWADKSGNARHATQSVSGSRPTVSVPSGGTEMVNGRRALLAFSSNAGGVGLGNIGSAFPNSSGTAFFAYKVNDGGTGIDNSYGIAMSRLNNSSTQSSGSNEGFWRTSRLAGTNPAPLPTSGYGAAIYTINSAASGYTLRYNSAPFYTTATQDWNAGNSYYLWSDPASNMTRLGGWIGEAILYNRSLSASETRRVEQYLSSRWGIAIAPQVSNADAQDWINRVYAAGSTVSQPVANAVSSFVDGCQSDGIWNAMKSAVLLAGANTLAGALTPLKGVAPTSFNFASGDYNRQTGLKGNGSTTYLDSNRANNADPQNSVHVSAYLTGAQTVNASVVGSGQGASGTTRVTPVNAASCQFSCRVSDAGVSRSISAFANGFMGLARSQSSEFVSRIEGANLTHSTASAVPGSATFMVFRTNGVTSTSDGRIAFYSIGESLDLALLDARVSALVTAIGTAP
jgi:hypothetical protein